MGLFSSFQSNHCPHKCEPMRLSLLVRPAYCHFMLWFLFRLVYKRELLRRKPMWSFSELTISNLELDTACTPLQTAFFCLVIWAFLSMFWTLSLMFRLMCGFCCFVFCLNRKAVPAAARPCEEMCCCSCPWDWDGHWPSCEEQHSHHPLWSVCSVSAFGWHGSVFEKRLEVWLCSFDKLQGGEDVLFFWFFFWLL